MLSVATPAQLVSHARGMLSLGQKVTLWKMTASNVKTKGNLPRSYKQENNRAINQPAAQWFGLQVIVGATRSTATQ